MHAHLLKASCVLGALLALPCWLVLLPSSADAAPPSKSPAPPPTQMLPLVPGLVSPAGLQATSTSHSPGTSFEDALPAF